MTTILHDGNFAEDILTYFTPLKIILVSNFIELCNEDPNWQ